MKKNYFLGAMLLASLGVFSQQVNKTYDFQMPNKVESAKLTAPKGSLDNSVTSSERALTVITSEDFSGGSNPLETSLGTWVTEGSNPGYWEITNGAHPLSGNGWTHAMNGDYLSWDSYSPNSGETNFATTSVDGAIVSPVFDLSSSPNGAILEIQTETMYCCHSGETPYRLYVSEDGGSTWSAPISLDFGVDRNVPTEDISHPLTFRLDISQYIANTPNNVKVKIGWKGDVSDGNGQFNTHYFWLIDDLTFYEVPSYEIENKKLWLADIVAGFENTEIPTSQAVGNLTVMGLVKNIGANAPTNFGLEVKVFDDTQTEIHSETGGTLANGLVPNSTDTITFATTFDMSTLAVGEYTVRSVVTYTEPDEGQENDTLIRTFAITENVMGHQNLDGGASYYDAGGPNDDNVQVGSFFIPNVTEDLHAVQVFIPNDPGGTSAATNTSAEMRVYVYSYEVTGGQAQYNYLHGPFTFNPVVGGWQTLNLHDALYENYSTITLNAGEMYVIAVEINSGEHVWFASNSFDEDYSGRIYAENTSGQFQWFWAGEEPLLRASFDESLNADDFEQDGFAIGQNVPNPFNNSSYINYSLNESSDVSFTVVDMTGKTVMNIDKGTQAAGQHRIDLDATNFAEGVYFYTFTVGDKKVTKKMVIASK